MKKSSLIKIFSIVIMSMMVALFSTGVFAADSLDDFEDLNLEDPANTTSNTNVTSNISNTNLTNTNTNANINTNTNIGNTNNSSVYTNTNLPKTGIGDTIPVAMLVVVFGISSIYAYKKVKEYRNI